MSGGRSGRSGFLTGGLVVAWVVGGGVILGGPAGFALVGLGLGLAVVMAMTLLGPLEAVEVERALPDEPVRAGASVDVSLTASSRGSWPWFVLQLEDVEPATWGARNEGRFFLLPHRTVRMTYRLPRVARGVHHFGQVRVCATDPFGFVRHQVLVDIPDELEVWPVPVSAEQARELLPAVRRHAAVGESGETRGVRPHHPGDPSRRIHWPATAKASRLMVRELEKAASAPLRVVVDLPSDPVGRRDRVDQLERAMSQAAGVVDWAMRHHRPVALSVLPGSLPAGREGSLPAGRGQVHYRRLMRLLAECRLPDSPEGLTPCEPAAREALLVRVTGEG